jgi:hypothetical protein
MRSRCLPPSPPSSTALWSAAVAGLLGGVACDGEGAGAGGEITSSVVDPDMTQEAFAAACDEEDGTLELHAHCGGENSCKGFSYDTDTDVLTEHTCKGLNTCAGYSCVVPEDPA